MLANAYFSITAACGKFAAALMLMFAILSFRSCGQAKLMLNRMSYKSGATSVILFFGTAFEYSILAVMLFNWTFSQMGYKALLNHFGCFIFATAGFLALAILTAQCKGTAVFDLYLWVRAGSCVLGILADLRSDGPSPNLCHPDLVVGCT